MRKSKACIQISHSRFIAARSGHIHHVRFIFSKETVTVNNSLRQRIVNNSSWLLSKGKRKIVTVALKGTLIYLILN